MLVTVFVCFLISHLRAVLIARVYVELFLLFLVSPFLTSFLQDLSREQGLTPAERLHLLRSARAWYLGSNTAETTTTADSGVPGAATATAHPQPQRTTPHTVSVGSPPSSVITPASRTVPASPAKTDQRPQLPQVPREVEDAILFLEVEIALAERLGAAEEHAAHDDPERQRLLRELVSQRVGKGELAKADQICKRSVPDLVLISCRSVVCLSVGLFLIPGFPFFILGARFHVDSIDLRIVRLMQDVAGKAAVPQSLPADIAAVLKVRMFVCVMLAFRT